MAQFAEQSQLSDVFYKLDAKHKARYHEKISMIRNEDPYSLKKSDLSKDTSLLPSLRYAQLAPRLS